MEGVIEVLVPSRAIDEEIDIRAEPYVVVFFEQRAADISSLLRYIYYGSEYLLRVSSDLPEDLKIGAVSQV